MSVFPALAGRLYTTAPPEDVVSVIILQNDYNELLKFQVQRDPFWLDLLLGILFLLL